MNSDKQQIVEIIEKSIECLDLKQFKVQLLGDRIYRYIKEAGYQIVKDEKACPKCGADWDFDKDECSRCGWQIPNEPTKPANPFIRHAPNLSDAESPIGLQDNFVFITSTNTWYESDGEQWLYCDYLNHPEKYKKPDDLERLKEWTVLMIQKWKQSYLETNDEWDKGHEDAYNVLFIKIQSIQEGNGRK